MEKTNFKFEDIVFDTGGIMEYRIATEGLNSLMSNLTAEAFKQIEIAVRDHQRSVKVPWLWEEDVILLERLGFNVSREGRMKKYFVIFW